MADKKVSVIVPTYNQEKYIGATLDHIVHQDYKNLEIIVCDDCSTDGTAGIANSYWECDPRITMFWNTSNIGGARNCNLGLDRATGDYVTIINGDDLPHPQMISRLVGVLEDTGADFVYSDMFIVDDDQRILRKFALPDYDFKKCFCDWYLCGVSKLWRQRPERFDPAIKSAGDYELFLRMAMAGAVFCHVPEVLLDVRAHGAARKVGLHTPQMENVAMEESAMLAERARAWLAKGAKA